MHAWLTRERVACAMELLETGLRPMEQVAQRAGFGSVESLRHHFRQQLDTTPVTYAARFGPAPPT